MRGVVKHSGRVVEINKDYVRVSVMALSACASCHAKDVCSSGDQKEKFIDVFGAKGYAVGDNVEVMLNMNTGNKAVIMAYVLPFVILMLVLMLLLWQGCSEGVSALVSLVAVGIYYLCVYLNRGKIEKRIHFTIRRTNN